MMQVKRQPRLRMRVLSWDQAGFVNNIVILPLSFLGGVFYSVDLLPSPWAEISHVNPIFFLINAFRYGFLGTSDVSVAVALAADPRRRAANERAVQKATTIPCDAISGPQPPVCWLLQPPAPHQQQLLFAASHNPRIALDFLNGFDHPHHAHGCGHVVNPDDARSTQHCQRDQCQYHQPDRCRHAAQPLDDHAVHAAVNDPVGLV